MKPVSFLMIVTLAMLLNGCSEERATNSGGGEYVLQYPDESYPMALVEARTLRAPDSLVRRIDRELVMIRERWGEDIPAVLNSNFWRPWYPVGYDIELAVDTAVFSGSDSVGYARIDSIARANGAGLKRGPIGRHFTVRPLEPWYPPEAVELFAGVPGVEFAYTGSTPIAQIYHSNLRVPMEAGARWFTMSLCESQLDLDIHQFLVKGRRVVHVGSVEPCVDIDTLWGRVDDVFEFMRAYEDSVHASQPVWVDTAMMYLNALERCNIRAWPEDYPTGCGR